MNKTKQSTKAGKGSAAKEHPFYCHLKMCRKTAWSTPEYMSEQDVRLLDELSRCSTADDFCERVFRSGGTAGPDYDESEAFFYRTIGWPEGRSYMRDSAYANWAWQMVKRDIDKAVAAIQDRLSALGGQVQSAAVQAT